MNVEVVRSARRTKTVQARLVGETLRIAIPDRMSPEEEAHWVELMTKKMTQRRRRQAHGVDLVARASRLAAAHHLSEPNEIVWSDRQRARWGSCSVTSGRVRISSQLIGYPEWVLDYVIVHELAHLAEPSHSPAFWKLVERYPRAERARGFLIAKGDEPDTSEVAPSEVAPSEVAQ